MYKTTRLFSLLINSGNPSTFQHLALGFLLGLITTLVAGCGGGGDGGSTNPAPPTITSVAVSGPAFVQAGMCNSFTATVSGTGNFSHSVQWSVNDIAGGNPSIGSISSSGNYCAPGVIPDPNPVSIKAASSVDASKIDGLNTRVIQVQISPTSANLYVGDTQQFNATVSGGLNNSVVWMVNGKPGGDSTVGTISSNGLYHAPPQVTTQGIGVQAASADTSSVYLGAQISVSGRILISPDNPQVTYGGQQQFTATVVGSTDTNITWHANYGSINQNGFYTASNSETPDTITARTSSADGHTFVQIVAAKPTISGVSPLPATAGQTITITGTNLQPPAAVLFSDAIGSTISVQSYDANGTSLSVVVPQSSVTGPLFVQTQIGGLSPARSSTFPFQRLARLRIRTPLKDLSAGESITLKYALLGDSTPRTVDFSADMGSFNGATYLAPSVSSDTLAHIKGCISGTSSCDSLLVAVHPFRVAPELPLLPLGSTLQFNALLGGNNTGATWSLSAGGGSLTAGGLYTASTKVRDGGAALLSATSSNSTQRAYAGVTGGFPGLINRVFDYADQHEPDAPGTYSSSVAIIGNRMYIGATNHLGAYTDSYYWIDVYDITDARQPTWITAVEAASAGPIYSAGQYLYSYANVDFYGPSDVSTITLYDVKESGPILKARTSVPSWWNISSNAGVLSIIPFGVSSGGVLHMSLFDLTGGTIAARSLAVVLPSDANSFIPDACIVVKDRLFLSNAVNDLSTPGYIMTYDISVSTPKLIGLVEGRSLAFYSSDNFLFGALGGMNTYDISGQLPTYLSHVDGINAWQLTGTKLLAITAQQGFHMVDLSDPVKPRISGTIFDNVITGWDLSVLRGSYLYAARGDAGIAVYDTSVEGGPYQKAILYGGGGVSWSETMDLQVRSPYVYGAASTGLGATLNIYDLSSVPPARVGEYFDPSQQAYAVQSSGNNLYLGMTYDLAVLDITQPTSPSLVTSLPYPVVSLDRKNATLYAGTLDKRLLTFNIANPSLPQLVSSTPLPDVPLRLRVAGNLLLAADLTGGLFIYDISTPSSPAKLSQITGMAVAYDVVVDANTAFIAADVDGLVLYNLANPASPTLISKTPLGRIDPFYSATPPNQAYSLALNNGIVYVGTLYDNGLIYGFDYSKPALPRMVSSYAHGAFILTSIDRMLFSGTDMLIGGSLGFTYSFAQADMARPFDTIHLLFPPETLQNPGPVGPFVQKEPTAPKLRLKSTNVFVKDSDPRYYRVPPAKPR